VGPIASLPGFIEHRFVAHDGVVVRALELRGASGGRTVVHFHNNRELAENSASIAHELAARGLGVLLVEYRGYGATTRASPSEEGLYADAEAALDLLAARGVGPDRIVLWGTSLGTGVAAEMARRGRGGRLVLVTPYTSIPDLVTNVAPFLPAGLLVADHFDTLAKALSIRVPTIVIHGDADEIVPYRMGERVAAAIPGARLLRIAGGHHGDLLQRARASIVDAIAGATAAPDS
jgi:pimeloyl-ACP methyl ester carboxylesterase